MKILVVSNLFPPYHGGGYGLHCSWYANGLAARGHSIDVLTSQPKGTASGNDDLSRLRVHRTLRFIDQNYKGVSLLRANLRNVKLVKNSINALAPDVVYYHGNDGVGINTYIAATESGVPSFTTIGDTWLAQSWRNLRQYDRWCDLASGGKRAGLSRVVKRLIGFTGRSLGLDCREHLSEFFPGACISEYLRKDLYESGAPINGKLCVIPPMLPREYFDGAGNPIGHSGRRINQLRVLFVGRLEVLKGMDTAIEGLSVALARGADVTLTFAGLSSSESREYLTQLADQHCVRERVILAGTPSDHELRSLYQNHDVFVFPSRIVEGFGLVNAEAMACGLPVIGTADHGSADIIIDNQTGFRIKRGDSQSLGVAIARLARDRLKLESMSKNCLKLVRRHYHETIIDQIEQKLEQVTVSSSNQAENNTLENESYRQITQRRSKEFVNELF